LEQAKEKMAFIEKKVKKRTPVNVKVLTYKDYTIHYIELKGFFALFFGKMFDKFEKPYYTYIEDYVVFSNSPASILSLIEDYEQGRLLKDNEGFKQVYAQFNNKSTYFAYINTRMFFPMLKPVLNEKTWTDLYAHKEIVYSFPYSGFQIIDEQQRIAMQLTLNYAPYKQEVITEDVEQEEDEDEEPDGSENDDIDDLNRFYAEKFQGNVYRDFYQDGALKSECEIRKGKRHGKYHEYYDNGTLKIRGKYVKGEPRGTWKYYTETGTFDKKVKRL
jgi:antitoxin component YwqK of YwqJK toxin-antitoxin module